MLGHGPNKIASPSVAIADTTIAVRGWWIRGLIHLSLLPLVKKPLPPRLTASIEYGLNREPYRQGEPEQDQADCDFHVTLPPSFAVPHARLRARYPIQAGFALPPRLLIQGATSQGAAFDELAAHGPAPAVVVFVDDVVHVADEEPAVGEGCDLCRHHLALLEYCSLV